jgi:chemotaxis protein methyltransferase CheR
MSPNQRLALGFEFCALKRFVIESTGLAYYADRDSDFANGVRRRMSALCLDTYDAYRSRLEEDGAGQAEFDLLTAELSIGETYFFRHKEQFDLLADVAIPAILARNRLQRRLRIWSAGCSIGAEPYSVAVLLKERFSAQLDGWDVQILGTDVNSAFLDRAREGCFDEWAFRSAPAELKTRWFTQHGATWRIRPEVKSWLSFRRHNLVRNPFPSLASDLACFDLILCRNVMIYFSPEIIRGLIMHFRESLADDGWLLVGHAEANQEYFRDFRAVHSAEATLHQKPAPGEGHLWQTGLPEVYTPWLAVDPLAPADCDVVQPEAQPTETSDPEIEVSPAEPPAVTLEQVRALADCGEWNRAVVSCEKLLECNNLDPFGHYYHALILEHLERLPEALEALHRAIYLDRSMAIVHYHQGLLLIRLNDSHQAGRAFETVLRLLRPADGDDEIANADGMTVADLRGMARMQLDRLEAQ